MDFSSGSSGNSGPSSAEAIEQVKQQIAIANFQELIQKITEKSFKKCVIKPGSSLDNSEQKCIAMAMDRYMDAFEVVSKTYVSRVQREMNK